MSILAGAKQEFVRFTPFPADAITAVKKADAMHGAGPQFKIA
jgi:hypothetical protein